MDVRWITRLKPNAQVILRTNSGILSIVQFKSGSASRFRRASIPSDLSNCERSCIYYFLTTFAPGEMLVPFLLAAADETRVKCNEATFVGNWCEINQTELISE